MEPSSTYYKTKRNLLFFVSALFLAVFVGFKPIGGDHKISVFPFELEKPDWLAMILAVVVLFNLFQFGIHWAAQESTVQNNRFHRIDFRSTTTISVLSLLSYAASLLAPARMPFVDWLSGMASWNWGVIVAIIVSLAITLFVGYVFAQIGEQLAVGLGRYLKKRAGLDDLSLRKKLEAGDWILIFNPKSLDGRKQISFERDGFIGKGHNQNEHRWHIKEGLLEIFREDDALQSRFTYLPETNEFVHTNDASTKSIRDQKIIADQPAVRAGRQRKAAA